MLVKIKSRFWKLALTSVNWLLSLIGASSLICRWGLQTQFIYLPKEPNIRTGNIVPYSYKGGLFYITENQFHLDVVLMYVSYVCLFVLVVGFIVFGSDIISKIMNQPDK